MSSRLKILLFCISAFVFVGCDRVTKDLAKKNLINGETISYFHDFFRLEYVENTGAAMSLGDDLSKTVSFWLLGIIPLCAMMLLFGYAIRKSKEPGLRKTLILSVIFAGGIGNLIDRFFFDRHVSDFMNVGVNGLRTGIFNFADMYILFGVLAWMFLPRKPDSVTSP